MRHYSSKPPEFIAYRAIPCPLIETTGLNRIDGVPCESDCVMEARGCREARGRGISASKDCPSDPACEVLGCGLRVMEDGRIGRDDRPAKPEARPRESVSSSDRCGRRHARDAVVCRQGSASSRRQRHPVEAAVMESHDRGHDRPRRIRVDGSRYPSVQAWVSTAIGEVKISFR